MECYKPEVHAEGQRTGKVHRPALCAVRAVLAVGAGLVMAATLDNTVDHAPSVAAAEISISAAGGEIVTEKPKVSFAEVS